MIMIFMIWPILEARTEVEEYFRSFFGSNENFEICFWDLLAFSFYPFQPINDFYLHIEADFIYLFYTMYKDGENLEF